MLNIMYALLDVESFPNVISMASRSDSTNVIFRVSPVDKVTHSMFSYI